MSALERVPSGFRFSVCVSLRVSLWVQGMSQNPFEPGQPERSAKEQQDFLQAIAALPEAGGAQGKPKRCQKALLHDQNIAARFSAFSSTIPQLSVVEKLQNVRLDELFLGLLHSRCSLARRWRLARFGG